MNNTQKAASVLLSVALGSIDAVMQLEKPKSARWNRLNGAVDQVNRCVELYRLESFSPADMDVASSIIDTVNDIITSKYP